MLAGFRFVAAAPQDALHAGIIRGQRTHFCGVQYKHHKKSPQSVFNLRFA